MTELRKRRQAEATTESHLVAEEASDDDNGTVGECGDGEQWCAPIQECLDKGEDCGPATCRSGEVWCNQIKGNPSLSSLSLQT